MFDPVQSARLTAGGELADRKFGGRGVREEASTRAVLWGRGGECGVCAGSSRAHKYSAETYTESVYVTSVQDRSRVSPAFGAKPGERESVCVLASCSLGKEGRVRSLRRIEGGKSRLVLLELDVYRICIRHVPQEDERGRSRVSPAFGAKPGEGGGIIIIIMSSMSSGE